MLISYLVLNFTVSCLVLTSLSLIYLVLNLTVSLTVSYLVLNVTVSLTVSYLVLNVTVSGVGSQSQPVQPRRLCPARTLSQICYQGCKVGKHLWCNPASNNHRVRSIYRVQNKTTNCLSIPLASHTV